MTTDTQTEILLFDWDDPAINDPEPVESRNYDDWHEKRQEDVKYCGYLSYRENPRNGRNKIFQNFCNEPDCSHCGPRIRDEMYRALSRHTEEKPLRKIVLTGDKKELNKQRAKIMRKYGGKEKVSTFACDILTEEGLTTQIEILIDTDEEIGEEYAEVDYKDVERWSQKSFNCKKSGNLHNPKPVTPAPSQEEDIDPFDPAEKIYYEDWTIDYSHKADVEGIEREVLKETSDLNPKTFDELKEAMETRRELRKKKLAEKEIVILSNVILFMTLKMSDVEWKWTYSKRPGG